MALWVGLWSKTKVLQPLHIYIMGHFIGYAWKWITHQVNISAILIIVFPTTGE